VKSVIVIDCTSSKIMQKHSLDEAVLASHKGTALGVFESARDFEWKLI